MNSFDFVSDLHVEHHSNKMVDWNPKSDILVIAGDISNDMRISYDHLITIKDYEYILFVDGNHEHYNGFGVDRKQFSIHQ